MIYLIPLLILATGPTPSIDMEGEEAVDVYYCDFAQQMLDGESREADINFDGWPDHWTRRLDRQHPRYVKIAIAGNGHEPHSPGTPAGTARPAGEPASGRWLQVDLDGGAAAAFTPSLDVSPRFTYLVEGRLRTVGLRHDAAYYSISFFDADDRLLERRESRRVQGDAWRSVRIGPFTPHSPGACKARIGLHVSPTEMADLTGTAMFADVRLARLPRMALTANSPHHVYTEAESIVLTCEVSGVRESAPELRLRLYDVFDQLVDEERRRLTAEPIERPALGAEAHGLTYAGSLSWTPRIATTGYYRAEAEMRTQQGVIHLRWLTLAVVAPTPKREVEEGLFGWSLPGGEEPLSLEAFSSLASVAGVQWVKLPVWFDADDLPYAERLARFVDRVEQDGITMVGVLDQPPPEARAMFGGEATSPIASVFVEREAWQAAIDPVMTRLSPIIRWWQLGADHDASFAGMPGLERKIQEIRRRLARFGQKVHVGFAWPWLEDRPQTMEKSAAWDFLSYTLTAEDPPLTAAELRRYLERLKNSDQRPWVTLQPLPRSRYDLTTRARDLVERMLAAKIGGAQAAFVPRPFDPESGLMRADGSPGDLFLAWRTTSQMLAGAEYVGVLELPQGSRNYVFARGEESVMLVWNERPVQETLYLGEAVRQVDLWSRDTSVPTRDGEQTIAVGPIPTFVTGMSAAIARWRISFQFEDPRLASAFGRLQTLEYRYQNPFPQGVSGRVTFRTPDVWDVDRGSGAVKLATGELHQDRLRVALRPTASSGEQTLEIDFEITADRDYRFRVWRRIDVGLGDVAMELSTRLDEEGRLVVEQEFINRSDEPVSFLCQLFAPGRPRIRRPVLYLNHGRTTITYHLPQGEELVGQMLLLRAEEINGDRALNFRFEAR